MEKNIYAQNKQEIKEISERENVPISDACAMLRDRMGWFEGEKDPQITEFTDHIRQLRRDTTEDSNLVAEYFAE